MGAKVEQVKNNWEEVDNTIQNAPQNSLTKFQIQGYQFVADKLGDEADTLAQDYDNEAEEIERLKRRNLFDRLGNKEQDLELKGEEINRSEEERNILINEINNIIRIFQNHSISDVIKFINGITDIGGGTMEAVFDNLAKEITGYDTKAELDIALNGENVKTIIENLTKLKNDLELLKTDKGKIEDDLTKSKEELTKIKEEQAQRPTPEQSNETFIKDTLGFENKEKLKEVLGDKTLKEYLDTRPTIDSGDIEIEGEELSDDDKKQIRAIKESLLEREYRGKEISEYLDIYKSNQAYKLSERIKEVQIFKEVNEKYFNSNKWGHFFSVKFYPGDLRQILESFGMDCFVLVRDEITKKWGIIIKNYRENHEETKKLKSIFFYISPNTDYDIAIRELEKKWANAVKGQANSDEISWYNYSSNIFNNEKNWQNKKFSYKMNKENDPTYSYMWCMALLEKIAEYYLEKGWGGEGENNWQNHFDWNWIKNESNWLDTQKKKWLNYKLPK